MIKNYIYKKTNNDFNIHIFLRNREIHIYKDDNSWSGEEIAFGHWWGLIENDVERLVNLFYLNEIVKQAPINEILYFKLPTLDINWLEVNSII